jgi:hypothetical protein
MPARAFRAAGIMQGEREGAQLVSAPRIQAAVRPSTVFSGYRRAACPAPCIPRPTGSG